ncbi:MAG TPA: bifunctional DedA family/phosphatase PAP2 family protein [Gemmatimonadales bacterium]|nr:bifunctional DedA family/phosphatase PAP2 family protein [Gemmatimonadales bacterium]
MASLIATYGYIVLFLLVGLESLGVPLPGETALVTAAALAGLGDLSIEAVIATAIAAAILGDTGGYWVGRNGGPALVRRYGRALHVTEAQLARANAFFARYGPRTVFLGRFIALLRTWVAVLAGAARMPYATFLLYNALGAACWSVLFGALGFVFARSLPELKQYISQASLALVLLVALGVALALGWRWLERNRARLVERLDHFGQRIVATRALARLKARYPGAWTFVTTRFARGEYLGLHLTLGLGVSLAGLWLFGAITEDVIHHDPLTQFDLTLFTWVRAHATPAGSTLFRAITFLGSPVTLTVLALAVAARLALGRHWILLGGWVAAFAGGGLLDEALKVVIRRPRPPGAALFLSTNPSWSFPSGHAMGSLIGYGMLAYVVLVLWTPPPPRRTRLVIVLGAALVVAAVGLSRLYLGVHYFSDVVGGYAAGLLWLAACISGLEVARRRPARREAHPAAA